jgi:hypothetical protein
MMRDKRDKRDKSGFLDELSLRTRNSGIKIGFMDRAYDADFDSFVAVGIWIFMGSRPLSG